MRADKYFADRFESRTKAAEAIEKGLVLVNGARIRPKDEIKETDVVTFVEAKEQFVSNGGYKLQRAVSVFEYDCKGKTFVDLGASTGGFTDCLLQNGATKVYAVDVGESLLHESLLSDERIVRMENVNARYLTKSDFPQSIDGLVADLSFISLRLIFPSVKSILRETGDAFVLVKPQFECEKKRVGKSGIVRTCEHVSIIKKVLGYAKENGLFPYKIVNAPVRKGKNIEYILHIRPYEKGAKSDEEILAWVKTCIKNNSLGILE